DWSAMLAFLKLLVCLLIAPTVTLQPSWTQIYSGETVTVRCEIQGGEGEYTFFSHIHHSYSRLDYFLVSSSLLSDISDTEIHPIAVSDHAPVSLTLMHKNNTTPSKNWRFNTSLLKDEDFIKYFKKEWTSYLDFNDTPGTSASVLWEA
uniref:Uncharacterized protein n=1 Tax=Oreochromis niloticus TaxID=8128 RepID=A0A669EY73_ORENI